jgi:hypothetical protein
MSNEVGGFGPGGPPPPAYPPPGYPPPGYAGYPPPGYSGYQPGYQGHPPPGYAGYPPPGYQGYPPPGYPPPGYPPTGYAPGPLMPPALKPGVIPLRPLTLGDIFNGAFAYIRANPVATLGLATVVVVAAQIVALILQVGPLAATGELTALRGEEASTAGAVGSSASGLATLLTTFLSNIVLSGMLTVVVGRAVFGAGISIGESWQRVRGRLLPLIGLMLLEVVGVFVLVVAVVFVIVAVGTAANGAAALAVGLLLGLGAVALLLGLSAVLAFAPPLIVLERLGVFAAIARSFKLVKGDFWRVLGIWLVAMIVTAVISGAVSIPFALTGELMLMASESTVPILIAMVLIAIGGAVGQIITTPFSAGVVVLLYADRRMRAEAFDLVLRTGAASGPEAAPESTDHLWLTRQP